jgi:hypothetical protein
MEDVGLDADEVTLFHPQGSIVKINMACEFFLLGNNAM